MKETYRTIASLSTGEFKDRGSKFRSYCYPFANEDDLKLYLNQLKKEHPKANHHCFAYRIGYDLNSFRYNDDGEPSGTAGKPILNAIDRHDLTNILIIVVRYFGGTKLGTSGLINAYRESAMDGLKNSHFIEKVISARLHIALSYEHVQEFTTLIYKEHFEIQESKFNELAEYWLVLPKSKEQNFINQLKLTLGKLYEVDDQTVIPGLFIKQID